MFLLGAKKVRPAHDCGLNLRQVLSLQVVEHRSSQCQKLVRVFGSILRFVLQLTGFVFAHRLPPVPMATMMTIVKQTMPAQKSVAKWLFLNSTGFFLALQVFHHAAVVTLTVAFLDLRYPPRDAPSLLGGLLLPALTVPIVGALVGLLLAAYPRQVLRCAGIRTQTWLRAGIAAAIGSYGLFLVGQFARAYTSGLPTLFDPPVLLSLGAALLLGLGQWYPLRGRQPLGPLWALCTVLAFAAGLIAAHALRHTYFLMLGGTGGIAVIYSLLLSPLLTALWSNHEEPIH
jgi:hypothetical protein